MRSQSSGSTICERDLVRARLQGAYGALGQILQGCQACELHRVKVNQPYGNKLPGRGDVTSPVIFVAQNPSVYRYGFDIFSSESRNDRYFVKGLASVGVDRERVFVTHLVKCSTEGNTIPTIGSIEPCARLWLNVELDMIKARSIVCIGRISSRYFGAKLGERGQWRERDVFAVKHPAYYVKNELRQEEYDAEFRVLRDLGAFDDYYRLHGGTR